jgi:hypothetical protein
VDEPLSTSAVDEVAEPSAGQEPVSEVVTQPAPGVSGWVERRVRSIDPNRALLWLLPWFMYLLNPNWIYSGFGNMDPWYYFGLSINYPRYQDLYRSYPGERLTWILPARLFVALFTPTYGWLLFHLCVYWVAVFSIYYAVRKLVNKNAALVTGALLASHGLFWGSSGWTYIDSGSLAYLALALAALACARDARTPEIWIVLGGMCWAGSVHNNLFWILLTPSCLLFYWGTLQPVTNELSGSSVWRRYIVGCLWFALGMLITSLIVMGCYYLIYGGISRTMYEATIGQAMSSATLKRGQALSGDESLAWVRTASWIIFPAVTCLVGLFVLARRFFFGKPASRLQMGVALSEMYAVLVLVYFTLRETQILRYEYYASILIPLVFIALGILVFPACSHLSKPALWLAVPLAVCFSIAQLWRDAVTHSVETSVTWHYLLALAACIVVILRPDPRVCFGSILALGMSSFNLAAAYTAGWILPFNGKAAMERVATAVHIIDAHTPVNQFPRFWLDATNDPNESEYRAIMCSYQSHVFSMPSYPKIDPSRHFVPGNELILMTRNKDIFEDANAVMTAAGMPLQLKARELISGPGYLSYERAEYWLVFTEVLPKPSTH